MAKWPLVSRERTMSTLLRIRQMYPTLAQNDRKLADFLLNNAEQARHLSSQKLAQLAGISQSSVVKFAQKLGYKGFPALKLALSETLAQPQAEPVVTVHNHILSSDTLKTVGEKLLAEKQAALRATLDINSEERLHQALDMLRQARRVMLIGIGASGLVAKDFSFKLLKIGVMAVAEADMHVQLAAVQALDKRDLLLAISFSGERREINLAAEEARQVLAQWSAAARGPLPLYHRRRAPYPQRGHLLQHRPVRPHRPAVYGIDPARSRSCPRSHQAQRTVNEKVGLTRIMAADKTPPVQLFPFSAFEK
jgi:DNA-binding MurR/RpiR family transcriptional regulator